MFVNMVKTRGQDMLRLFVLALVMSLMVGNSYAAKEFAEQKIVLQISDPNPFKQTLVLNVANNLLKHYGQDSVEVEIVAFGPGMRLLLDGNANTGRIQGLVTSGVRFSACENTIKGMSKQLGHTPVINKNAVKVSAGVVRIIDLQKKGYKLIKP